MYKTLPPDPGFTPPDVSRRRLDLARFIGGHPVFRLDDLMRAYPNHDHGSLRAALHYHVRRRKLRIIHRGVYTRPLKEFIDPYLLGSRLVEAGVIAQEGALSFHGLCAPTLRIPIVSRQRLRLVRYRRHHYLTVRYRAGAKLDLETLGLGVGQETRQGMWLGVHRPERAFVDCCQRMENQGGLEWTATHFLAARDLRPDLLAEWAVKLCSRIGAARVALLMEAHRELKFAREALAQLKEARPRSPTVFDPAHRHGGHLVARWNVIIPEWFLQIRQNLL